jgi:hypothetical protein
MVPFPKKTLLVYGFLWNKIKLVSRKERNDYNKSTQRSSGFSCRSLRGSPLRFLREQLHF